MTPQELITALCGAGVPRNALSVESAVTATIPDGEEGGGWISLIERADSDGPYWMLFRYTPRDGVQWISSPRDVATAVDRTAVIFTGRGHQRGPTGGAGPVR